ncbi:MULTISPECIES: DUF4156 domain-containing protein [Gammaproteobacteria]|uniref:DUF4156 domain-containing protein n=1 Tax=Xanthomonas boreopolis TaxID=86183 RepID=A0A919F8G4_9XANT|nr:DUF4156 domain-containing protein [Pseudomonas sp. Hp2]GHH54287.1 hypothetical protein GCM10009090_20850 [[Pseudomonas] boreopolis]
MRSCLPLVLVASVALSACTWVPIEQAGKAVRVLPAGPVPAGCVQQGEVVVSVKNRVGFINRNPLKVKDELETLARNEAPSAGANAVQPQGEPADGSQRFTAFRCPGR